MGFRSVGRLKAIIAGGTGLLFLSCAGLLGGGSGPKNMSAALLFGEGASSLENISNVAVRGRIEFGAHHSGESGSFALYMSGRDSSSFVIEGPLGADAFRMVVIGNMANVRTEEGWIIIGKDERLDFEKYGLENVSPFRIGRVILPQYYTVDVKDSENAGYLAINIGGEIFSSRMQTPAEYFELIDPETGIEIEYSSRNNIENGFYPSRIEISNPQSHDWKIKIRITKIRKNVSLPARIWQVD